MKRNIIIALIALCVGITLYIERTTKTLEPGVKSRVEAAVLADERFPARPVWWENDSVLAVGVFKKQDDHSTDARDICKLVLAEGIESMLVEMYDIEKIQIEDDWQRIGSARCDRGN